MLTLLLVVSSLASAEGFWVVGSFEREPAARSAAIAANGQLDTRIKVARMLVSGRTMHRVLVPKSSMPDRQKAALANAGYSAWSLDEPETSLNIVLATDDLPEPRFYLVLAAFSSEERALALAQERDANVRMSDDGDLVRVVRGPFGSRNQAEMDAAKSAGMDGAWWLDVTESQEQAQPASSTPRATPPAEASTRTSVTRRAPESSVPASRPTRRPTPPSPPTSPSTPSREAARHSATEMPAEPEITPPIPGQSYVDYCLKEAKPTERAMFCSGNRFQANAVRERRTGEPRSRDVLLDFCARDATATQRQAYCQNIGGR